MTFIVIRIFYVVVFYSIFQFLNGGVPSVGTFSTGSFESTTGLNPSAVPSMLAAPQQNAAPMSQYTSAAPYNPAIYMHQSQPYAFPAQSYPFPAMDPFQAALTMAQFGNGSSGGLGVQPMFNQNLTSGSPASQMRR